NGSGVADNAFNLSTDQVTEYEYVVAAAPTGHSGALVRTITKVYVAGTSAAVVGESAECTDGQYSRSTSHAIVTEVVRTDDTTGAGVAINGAWTVTTTRPDGSQRVSRYSG